MNANKGKDPMQKILLLVLYVVVGFSGMVSGLATEEQGVEQLLPAVAGQALTAGRSVLNLLIRQLPVDVYRIF